MPRSSSKLTSPYRAVMTIAPHLLTGSTITIAPMGVGTWAWGDRSTWGMGTYGVRCISGSRGCPMRLAG